ncbi:MAG: amidohydrolase family protein [Clostridia bacterium]|nr:amidohydrolase family protein [Clostridia bacterium]
MKIDNSIKTYTLYGTVILHDRAVERGALAVRDGVIEYAGDASGLASPVGETFDLKDSIIAPGFVDIHCHAGGTVATHVDPVAASRYHLRHGTTSMLCTIYRGFTTDEYLTFIARIKDAMSTCGNIKGVHLEGPYLNPRYGAEASAEGDKPIKENYMKLAATGMIKQWTSAPEVEGVHDFISDIASYGIVPAIGHSSASPGDVAEATRRGAKIVTHLFDATGKSVEPTRYDGTIEVSFNAAALLQDDMYYELICDREEIHVRGDLVRLAAKCVGVDRLIAITDACEGESDVTDVNIVNGELYGSLLTMDRVAANIRALGFPLYEVFRMTSSTPAKVIGLDRTGELKRANFADVVVLDGDFNVQNVLTSY